ncbi:MAG: hypothetical protein OER97_06840 [Gammaproteobacteria bacterium]|nr:hypothetical protein [Gammaproteobacteria bacterium]
MAAQDERTLYAEHVNIELGEGPKEQPFKLKNDVNCSRPRTFRILLSPSEPFPEKTWFQLLDRAEYELVPPFSAKFELGNPDDVDVYIKYDANQLTPGTYTADFTISCENCEKLKCRVGEKFVQITMNVIAPDAEEPTRLAEEIEQPTEEELPSETTIAQNQETESGTDSTDDGAGRADSQRSGGSGDLDLQSDGGGGDANGGNGGVTNGGNGDDSTDGNGEDANGGNGGVTNGGNGDGKPPIENGLKDVWLPIVALLVILGFTTLYWRHSRGPKTAPAAKFDVRSHVDPGTQTVSPDISDRARPVIRVRLQNTAGEQSVHGDPDVKINKEQ